MTLAASCPHCHKVYRVENKNAGRALKCRICGSAIPVPAATVPDPEIIKSPGGAPILRHRSPTTPPEMVSDATPFLNQISAHIERTIGPAPMIFHELVSTSIHIDLHFVPPTNRPPSKDHPLGTSHATIVTSGVSSRAMNLPPRHKGPKYIELMIALPPAWPGLRPDGTLDQDVMKDQRWWWLFRWLKNIARLPSELNTFLGIGHTVPNGEAADPFASNTRLGCMLLVPPLLSPKSMKLVVNDNATIQFLALMPLYPEEMRFCLSNGSAALADRLADADVTELIRIDRESVVRE